MNDEIEIRADGAVRVVTLSRPDAYNAVNENMHYGLSTLWARLADDPGARSIVLTGAGRAFCAGGDQGWMTVLREDANRRREIMAEAAAIVTGMVRCPLPIVAAVNGPAVGLGCTLAVLSDLVVMSERAYLSDPHVSIGLVAGDGGAVVWPLAVGPHRARELLYLGDRVDAATAHRLGVANRVVPAEALLGEAMGLARRLAEQPAQALRDTKRAINLHLEAALETVLPFGIEAETASFTTDEHRDALAAMVASRRG
ncbi:enoyl-CoA hydratase/isomerase family protein [Micromonospora sp. NPDC005087]|uniref:enoyl-CoA hydratase/isomerase family protein n=1 Tax=Micromonospora sp. NPDC005087 TaxID=3364225 RepID=UPI0036B24170